MNKLITISLAAALITGCAGSPMRISSMSQAELKTQPSNQLCNAYYHFKAAPVKAELKRRGEITDADWKLIEQGKIQVGMSKIALACSWGFPGIQGKVNTYAGPYGTMKQIVYRACFECPPTFVYIDETKVTGWQG